MTIIRPSEPSDGATIKSLVAGDEEVLPGIDWSANQPFWLVADDSGEVVGCIQAVAALPIGYISNLAVREDRRMGRLKLRLCFEALRSLKASGCQYAVGFVPSHMVKWKRALLKAGAVEGVDGTIYSMSLKDESDGR